MASQAPNVVVGERWVRSISQVAPRGVRDPTKYLPHRPRRLRAVLMEQVADDNVVGPISRTGVNERRRETPFGSRVRTHPRACLAVLLPIYCYS